MTHSFSIMVINENGDCIVSKDDQFIIKTSLPPEFKGTSRNTSSTELLAISLATCVASSFALNQNELNIPLTCLKFKVNRTLQCSPKVLESIKLTISSNQLILPFQLNIIKDIIKNNTVRNGLSDSITSSFYLEQNGRPAFEITDW